VRLKVSLKSGDSLWPRAMYDSAPTSTSHLHKGMTGVRGEGEP
jgi:hypothetical protein